MMTNSEYTETENEFRRSLTGRRVSAKELLANPDILRKWNYCMTRNILPFILPPPMVIGPILYSIVRLTRIQKYASIIAICGSYLGYIVGRQKCFIFCLQDVVGVKVIRADNQNGLHLTFGTEFLSLTQQKKTLESEEPKQSDLDYEDFRFSNTYSNDLHSINGVDEYTSIVDNGTKPSNSQKSLTYNELRQKHREEYAQQMYGKNVESLPAQQKAPPRPPSDTEPVKPVKRNKYGDIME